MAAARAPIPSSREARKVFRGGIEDRFDQADVGQRADAEYPGWPVGGGQLAQRAAQCDSIASVSCCCASPDTGLGQLAHQRVQAGAVPGDQANVEAFVGEPPRHGCADAWAGSTTASVGRGPADVLIAAGSGGRPAR